MASHRLIHIQPANAKEEKRLKLLSGMEGEGVPIEEQISSIYARYGIQSYLYREEHFKCAVALMNELESAGVSYAVG